MTVALVDAENVRRSRWPNIAAKDLLDLVAEWSEREGVEAVVVFEGDETADDVIARKAADLAAAGRSYWLVTSDRELRERAGGAAERVIGGGAFAGVLLRVRNEDEG